MRDIGKNIKQVRESKLMTQDDLAAKLFVSRQTISNYETGRTRPDIETLIKLSSVLDIDIHVLIYGPPSVLTRSKILKRLCLSAISVVILLLGNYQFAEWAEYLKQMKYNVIPTFILNIIYRPVMYSIIGYIIMLCVSTFYQVAPIKERSAKIIKALIIILVVIYVFVVGPLLLSALIPFKLPTLWSKAAYMILGALPSQNAPFSHYGVSFLLGILFWLSNHVQDKTKG